MLADSAVLSAGGTPGSRVLCLLSGDFLLLALHFVLLVDQVLAVGEVRVDLWEDGTVVLGDPGVLEHVRHLGAGGWVELQEARDQVFEFFREIVCAVRLIFGVCFPEEIGTVRTDQSIERVCGLSSRERGVLGEHNEKNDGCCEEVN
jgi:hypothetical protein